MVPKFGFDSKSRSNSPNGKRRRLMTTINPPNFPQYISGELNYVKVNNQGIRPQGSEVLSKEAHTLKGDESIASSINQCANPIQLVPEDPTINSLGKITSSGKNKLSRANIVQFNQDFFDLEKPQTYRMPKN